MKFWRNDDIWGERGGGESWNTITISLTGTGIIA